MKKQFAKLLSVVLALVMVLAPSSVAFAKTAVTPVILVHGLGGNDLYANIGTDNQTALAAYGLDIKAMLTDKKIAPEALKLLGNTQEVNYDVLFKALGNYFKASGLNCDENGNAPAGQGIINYWTTPLSQHKEFYQDKTNAEGAIARQLCETQGAKNVYAFNYDWRLDVCENAKYLRQMIVAVKKRTGAQKVSLVGCSLGGAILSAYMDAYKAKNDIARYVFVNPAMNGVDVARMYRYDVKLNKSSVLTYLKHMATAYDGGSRATLFNAIAALGDVRIGYAVDNLNEVAGSRTLLKKLYLQALKPWIGNIPAYWECIAYEDFDKCTEEMAKIGFLNKKSGLYKKISAYHKVQGRFNKNIKYVKKKGAEVAILANYGTMGIPVTSKLRNHTDILVDTKYASAGATVAQYGKTLKAKGKYVSPDKVIDASTCVLPDNTWFIKDILHLQYHYGTDATQFIANLACGKVKLNLKAVKKKYGYSQFIKGDVNQSLSNVTA